MTSLRWIVFVLLFFMDVHVRASESQHKTDDIKEASCWGHSFPCAEQAKDSKRVLKQKKLTLVMGMGAIAEQRDANIVQLVRGQFYLETSKSISFQTPFGKISCETSTGVECKSLVWREMDSVNIRSLAGTWKLIRTGDKTEYALPPGLQTVLGQVNETGKSSFELPQSLPWSRTVRDWVSLYPGESKEFKEELEAFHPVWIQAVESVSELHTDLVRREIAAYKAGIAAQKARAARQAAEDERLKSMFREKNYLNP